MPDINNKTFWMIFSLAALSFLPALNFYYVGEEAIHPIIAMEIQQSGLWLNQPLYGLNIQHIPLYNWLILLLSNIFGWEHMLAVARGIAISATISSALMLAWFTKRITDDIGFASFAALAYLTLEDVLLYHGWLAYVDPLFALFVFASISFLMVATLEQKAGWLLLAILNLTLAFMSRGLTAYVFYGTAIFVLLWDKGYREFLLKPSAMLIHAFALVVPGLWFMLNKNIGHGGRMFSEIIAKLSFHGLSSYLEQIILFPLETLLRLSPLVLLAGYLLFRKRIQLKECLSKPFRMTVWIALLCYLPYWLSPQSSIRYLLPLYPLAALLAARIIWSAGDAALVLTRNWIIGIIVLKFALVLFIFPYYQDNYRGKNYDDAAADILKLINNYPLYTADVSASGLNVTAYVDQRRYPQPTLQWPPAQWQTGYVLARSADPALGEIYKKYQLGGDELYLLCRGDACDNPAQTR